MSWRHGPVPQSDRLCIFASVRVHEHNGLRVNLLSRKESGNLAISSAEFDMYLCLPEGVGYRVTKAQRVVELAGKDLGVLIIDGCIHADRQVDVPDG